MEVDPHLFRHSAGRMVAALTRIFGVHNMALAEDVTQDALCRAVEVWKFSGVPDNPSAWLMATAKNRALDILRRDKTARTYEPELARLIGSEWTLATTLDERFQPGAIRDDQLRMMFSCCQPRLPEEAQLALVLNVLCGFGAAEVASALLTSEAAAAKRLTRAKKVLASSKSLFELEGEDLAPRLAVVQRALYLLFNEGYQGASPESSIRVTLCHEAMNLASMLLEHPSCATPTTHALLALMSLHAARMPARMDEAGDLLSLIEQDRSRWDARLASEGLRWLALSASGDVLSEYHVEAAIASVHATAPTAEDTQWKDIVGLYDTLMILRPSPAAALGRAIALGQAEGPERGLEALHAIEGRDRLESSPFYAAAIAELELRRGYAAAACAAFELALTRARSPAERTYLERRARIALTARDT